MSVDSAGRPVAPGRRSPKDLPEQKGEDGSEKLTGCPEKLGESILHKLVVSSSSTGRGGGFFQEIGRGSASLPAIGISPYRSALLFLVGIRYHPRDYGGAIPGHAAYTAASIAERG